MTVFQRAKDILDVGLDATIRMVEHTVPITIENDPVRFSGWLIGGRNQTGYTEQKQHRDRPVVEYSSCSSFTPFLLELT